jgi:hypothetical protein
MKIKRIEIRASHTFSNPNESYSNYQVSAQLDAEIAPTEDVKKVARELQVKVDSIIAEHKEQIKRAREIERRAIPRRGPVFEGNP